jgi:hypothetical protein
VFLLAGVTSLFAQTPPPPSATPVMPPRPPTGMQPGGPGVGGGEKKLEGVDRLRFILKQLRLDEKQTQQAEALLTVYQAECKEEEGDPAGLMMRIQQKYAEVQDAESRGDKATADVKRAELREMAPGKQPEKRFFESLGQNLTPEQKQRLPGAIKRAEGDTSQLLRPIHVLRAARSVKLDAQQTRKVDELLDAYRTGLTTARPQGLDDMSEYVEKLIVDVRAVLKPDQATAFDATIARLRDNVPPPAQIELPGRPAAAPPSGPMLEKAPPPPTRPVAPPPPK